MPPEEQAICRRLRQFRLSTRLSQAELANLVGLDPRAYASYEYCRSQLNYPAAWRILNVFRSLNPMWLAEGEGMMNEFYFVAYPSPDETGLGPRAPFSLVYYTSLRATLYSSRSAFVDPKTPFPLFRVGPGASGRLAGREIFSGILSDWLAARPDSQISDFLNSLLHCGSQLLDTFPRDKDEEAIRRRTAELTAAHAKLKSALSGEKKGLTEDCQSVNIPPVKLRSLLTSAKQYASKRGGKTALASFLPAPLASVSRWLSGKREPGGEVALRMLEWVQVQEAKQKNSGSVQAPPEPKTQLTPISYEKSKPGRKKR